MENKVILKTENISHVYSAGTPFETTAIGGISLDIRQGDVIAIVGHTGSGKSTLIQHLNGLIKPTSGRVLFDGVDIASGKAFTKEVRFNVGLVFQYPEYQIFEETVYKDIAFGPKNMRLDDGEIDARVREAARFSGVGEELLDRSPFDLSGGQKRRVAIAGVIAMMPQVLILDEPTAGLDPRGRDEIMKNILSYHREKGAAIIIVTHNMDEAAKYADRIIVMDHGRIAMDGSPAEIFSRGTELESIGLTIPSMTRLFLRLEELGLPFGEPVYTIEQAKRAVLSLRGGASDA